MVRLYGRCAAGVFLGAAVLIAAVGLAFSRGQSPPPAGVARSDGRGGQPAEANRLAPAAAPADGAPPDHHPTLTATLWMQGAAEYAALCRQVYASARNAVLAAPTGDNPAGDPRPRAVVLDLDETVFDNSRFQALVINGILPPGMNSFLSWAASHPAGIELVPGARDFIDAVRAAGVQVVFVSNRPEKCREATVQTLRRLGIPSDGHGKPTDLGLLLSDGGSDKRPRFRQVEEACRVLAYVGDSLGDFPESFDVPPGALPSSRRDRVEALAGRFGTRWFILPNPVYGDWARGLGKRPSLHLILPGE